MVPEGDILAVLFRIIVTPLVGFLLWTYKRQQMIIDELKERMSKAEKSDAVMMVMFENVKEDVKSIKYGIEKIADNMARIERRTPNKQNDDR